MTCAIPVYIETGRALETIVEEHPLWSHPLLKRCRAGDLGLRELRVLACQMYRFSKAFTRFLAAALAACDDEAARIVIAQNLWEELGDGDVSRTHAELFRRFTRSLGIDDATLEQSPIAPETEALVDTYQGLAARHGFVGAIAAICYASEGLAAALYSSLQVGIHGALPLDKESLMFFTVHIACDDGHAAALERVLDRALARPADEERAAAAIREALDARHGFFDGVLRLSGVRTVTAPTITIVP
ncbi:MAG TPA: iron-containing redox enzyme family protein [Kofleriaceae bacterium]|nr:iron-containing redox enzyme family protein [Kofleriaceae bacterium]